MPLTTCHPCYASQSPDIMLWRGFHLDFSCFAPLNSFRISEDASLLCTFITPVTSLLKAQQVARLILPVRFVGIHLITEFDTSTVKFNYSSNDLIDSFVAIASINSEHKHL